MRLDGKVVLITGASEGIGAACANALRARGARLSLLARSEQKLQAVARDGDLVIPADLTRPDTRTAAVDQTVRHFGRIDVLLNNAGVGLYIPAHQAPIDEVRRLFELNFFAALELAQRAAEHMKSSGGGTIVNVSSIGGKVTLPWFTIYSASKYALGSLTDGLRIELRRHGIRCMTVCPGYVKTRFQSNVLSGQVPDALSAMRQRWAITPEQCAAAIVRGLERDSRTVVTPAVGWVLIALARLFPRLIEGQFESVYLQHSANP